MKKMKYVMLSCIVLALFGCNGSSVMNGEPASIEQLDGHTFLYVVEREIEGPLQDFTIDDSLYVEVGDGDEYEVEFSEDHASVLITPGELQGSLQTEENDSLEYNISDGYFAGGRFVVWIEDEKFYAELTEFGSGIPIIASGKGSLTIVK